jgi:RNA polymerase sigma-B factor
MLGNDPDQARAPRAREDARLFERFHATRSPELRERLVLRYMPLARQLAGRYADPEVRDDLMQVASLALVNAIDRYDPARGSAFSSFAVPTIAGEIKRYFRDLGWAVRVPRDLQEQSLRVRRASERLTSELGRSPTAGEVAAELGCSVEDVLEALATASAHRPDRLDPLTNDGDDEPQIPVPAVAEPGYERVEHAATLESLLDALDPRDRTILRLRFEDDLTQSEIGSLLGMSQMQISRLLRRAITTLQDAAAESRDRRTP